MAANDIFSEYMSRVGSYGQDGAGADTKAGWQEYMGSPQYQQGLASFYQWRRENPHLSDNQNPYYDTISQHGSAVRKFFAENNISSEQTKEIKNSYSPVYGFITGSSQAAGDLLRSGYEDAFRARAAGYAGSQGAQEDQLGVEMAGQGLSGDVARRMIGQQRAQGLQGLAAARGELSTGLNTGLSELAKGTGTELATAAANQAAIEANYLAATKGAKAAQRGAETAAIAQAFGAVAGGYLGKPNYGSQ